MDSSIVTTTTTVATSVTASLSSDTIAVSTSWKCDARLSEYGIKPNSQSGLSAVVGIPGDLLRHLISIIPREPWGETPEDTQGVPSKTCDMNNFPKLRQYLLKILAIAEWNGRIVTCQCDGRTFLAFHTMLITSLGVPIYGILAPVSETNLCETSHTWHMQLFASTDKLQERKFCQTHKIPMITPTCEQPYGPTWFQPLQTPAYNPSSSWSQAVDTKQFIDSSCSRKLQNLPASYIADREPQVVFEQMRDEAQRVRQLALVQPRIAVPYPTHPSTEERYDPWLLFPIFPLSFDRNKPHYAMVEYCLAVSQYVDGKGQYQCRIQAVLEVETAYWKARLMGSIDQTWLRGPVLAKANRIRVVGHFDDDQTVHINDESSMQTTVPRYPPGYATHKPTPYKRPWKPYFKRAFHEHRQQQQQQYQVQSSQESVFSQSQRPEHSSDTFYMQTMQQIIAKCSNPTKGKKHYQKELTNGDNEKEVS